MSHYKFFAALVIFCSLSLSAQTTALNDNDQWHKLGLCSFTNDIIAIGEPSIYDVTIEENLNESGIYRIIDIWENFPDSRKKDLEREGFTFYYGDDYYITFDLRDPQYVRIPESPLGLSDQDGDYSICSPSEIIGKHVGIDEDYALSRAGKFSNGIISFPQQGALFLRQDRWFTRSNLHGATCIDLSEYVGGITDILEEDYSDIIFFNLQGIPVSNPGSGIYILRKGAKTSKVLKR